MKILHCGDIHLESPLAGVADSEKRQTELLLAFFDVVEYAKNKGISAVLVAGDLFDGDFTRRSTLNSVLSLFESNPKLEFFIVCGNHGGVKDYNILKDAALKNVHFFSNERFETYFLKDVAISGTELGCGDEEKYANLNLPTDKFNIVLLHGDTGSNAYGLIDQKTLEKKGCNYLALGHLHSYSQSKLGRMSVVYSGVLETRGFDEPSASGFVVLDTDSGKHSFVGQARRTIETVTVDASACKSNFELLDTVKKSIALVGRSNYLNIILTGVRNEGVSAEFLKESLNGEYFALRVENKMKIGLDLEKLKEEYSLKGQFVNLALKIEDEKLRDEVLTLGLSALSGEKLTI